MFSIRAAVRAAPRSIPRLASYSTRASLRPAFQLAIRPSPAALSTQIPRCFSTSISRKDNVSQELAAKLQSEYELESGEKSRSQDVLAYLKENLSDWTLEDKDGEHEVIMRRKYDDGVPEEITVGFSIADFDTPDPLSEEEDDAYFDGEFDEVDSQSGGANTKGAVNQGRTSGGNMKVAPEDSVAPADREELRNAEDETSGDEAPSFEVQVSVLVQRQGKGALRFILTAEDALFNVQSVQHIPESKVASVKATEDLLRDDDGKLYTGPPFQNLDPELQDLVEGYLSKRGLDTSLAWFIPEYVDLKELKEYTNWLKNFQIFLQE